MKNQNVNTVEGFDGEMLHPSFDIKDGILILGFRYKNKTGKDENIFFVVKHDTIRVEREDSCEIDGKRYFFEIKGKTLMRVEERWGLKALNEFVKDYSSGKTGITPTPKELFEKTKILVKKYVELEKEIDYSLVIAWIIGTYFFPIFPAYPFLLPKGPKGSGKTQFLNLLEQLCFNAIKARPSLPALGDTVDSLRGTYLIDQADSLWREKNEDLLDILADSYKRKGGKRRIMSPDKNKREVLEFETYGPKALAAIRELPEDLRDRFLTIPLIRSAQNFPDPDNEDENWKEIRGGIYKFLIENHLLASSTCSVLKTQYKLNPEVFGRTLELWLPLETMLKCLEAGEEEVKEARRRFLSQYQFSEYEPSEFEREVIKGILSRFQDGDTETILSPKKIGENMDPDVFQFGELPIRRAVKVGWALKNFNLFSEKRPRTKEGVHYLFEKKRVENIYKRYFAAEPTLLTPSEKNNSNREEVEGVENIV
ncbi:MAG: hypothetical protein Q8N16_02520 [bacterium]|nr:hypothetical protein [bacterium]